MNDINLLAVGSFAKLGKTGLSELSVLIESMVIFIRVEPNFEFSFANFKFVCKDASPERYKIGYNCSTNMK